MLVSVVVPTYNEGLRLQSTLDLLVPTKYEVIVVDDGSEEDTAEIVRGYPIHFLSHPVNCGQGAALKTGTEYARQLGSDLIAHFDADGQHRVEDLEKMIAHLQNNDLDIVLGSRFMNQETTFPLQKRIILQLAKIFSDKIMDLDFSDPQSGLRVFKTNILDQLDWQKNDFLHCTEILSLIIENKLRYQELPIIVNYHLDGKKEVRPRLSMGLKIVLHKLFH
ncbi:MAG: Glycosyl transferase family 2 [Parcubacteria group bacterium GW2011_GWA2_40_23]|nr:MAG: Glycosyl transferase family 2 [Parcubacteria group bacterium GW2011_GWA2_40_23]